jgi:hypothetical protein
MEKLLPSFEGFPRLDTYRFEYFRHGAEAGEY